MDEMLVLIAHNIRSAHNVGSLMRTSDGLGIEKLFLTGYTPHPTQPNDKRLPHIAKKNSIAINKTALGAQDSLKWVYEADIFKVMESLKQNGYTLVAVEQSPQSIEIYKYNPAAKTALIVGNEVEGLEKEVLSHASEIVEIPMEGKKESLNVVVAAAIAIYHCRSKLKLT